MRKIATWKEAYSRAKQIPELCLWIMFSSYISDPIVVKKKFFSQLVHTVLMGRPLVDLQEIAVNYMKVDWTGSDSCSH